MSISDELPANLSDVRTTAKIELLVAEESVILGGGAGGDGGKQGREMPPTPTNDTSVGN